MGCCFYHPPNATHSDKLWRQIEWIEPEKNEFELLSNNCGSIQKRGRIGEHEFPSFFITVSRCTTLHRDTLLNKSIFNRNEIIEKSQGATDPRKPHFGIDAYIFHIFALSFHRLLDQFTIRIRLANSSASHRITAKNSSLNCGWSSNSIHSNHAWERFRADNTYVLAQRRQFIPNSKANWLWFRHFDAIIFMVDRNDPSFHYLHCEAIKIEPHNSVLGRHSGWKETASRIRTLGMESLECKITIIPHLWAP